MANSGKGRTRTNTDEHGHSLSSGLTPNPFSSLIVFDIDGTLFETHRVTVPAVQRTLAAYGLPIPDAETVCRFFGQPNELYLEWLGARIPESHRTKVVDAVNRLELELVATEGRLYPGVREMLESLAAEGHVLALCSNGPEDYVKTVVEAFELAPLCAVVRARGTRYPGKSAMLEEILSIIPARPAVMIGDRRDDIESAHHNGMRAVAADYGFGSSAELTEADSHAVSPGDLERAIRGMLGEVES
jgi:phosphoglycolate phosphatase